MCVEPILQGEGWLGLPEEAPFDAIHVGAGAGALLEALLYPRHLTAVELPSPLVDQLANGGTLLIPVHPTLSYSHGCNHSGGPAE